MKKIVILISGRGTNMEAVVRACAREGWPARVAAVISNRPDAAGLAFAAANGIETNAVDHRKFETREAFDQALSRELDRIAAVAPRVTKATRGAAANAPARFRAITC